jgi:large subunit ribosomal protein L30
MKKIKVILKKSLIDKQKRHKMTLKALGLTRIGQSRIYPNNKAVQGMIRQVSYLVEVEEVKDAAE